MAYKKNNLQFAHVKPNAVIPGSDSPGQLFQIMMEESMSLPPCVLVCSLYYHTRRTMWVDTPNTEPPGLEVIHTISGHILLPELVTWPNQQQ